MEIRRDRPPTTALLIAAVAGLVDAVGFVTMGGLFLSFMSGNVTHAGVSAATGGWTTAGLALGLVLLFVGGVAAGALVAGRLRRPPAGTILLMAAVLVAAAAWLGQREGVQAVPTLVMAMGLLNMAFAGPAGGGYGVTYLTGALVRIGAAIGGPAGARGAMAFDLAQCAALALGVLAGARFHPIYGSALLWPAAAVLLVAAVLHGLADRRR